MANYQKDLDTARELLFEWIGEEEGWDMTDELVIGLALTRYKEFLQTELRKGK